MLGFDSLESYALMSSGVTRIKNTDLVEKNWVEIRKPYLVTKYSSSLTFDVPWIFSGNEGNYLPGPVVAMLPLANQILGDRISFFIFIDSRLLWNRVVGMASYGIDDAYSSNPESSEVYVHERNSSSREGMQEVESTMEVLTRVDCDLAYSSEKLVNLHVLLVHLLAQDNNLEARMATENSYILATAIEKALAFDLLSGILDSEVREVEKFMENLQSEIVDARHKISSCRHSTDLFTVMENKLHNSEESLIKFREHVLEVKAQSAKLPMAFSASILENWKDDKATELPANGQISNMDANSKRQTAEKQRNVLRMLDKSLKREMEVQKKISALKQNEEHLELKLHYTKQVSFRMEEAAEVVWGRFLEAENASEVLMGISKEMAGRLQIFQFTLNGSIQREDEFSSKLQDCIKQRDAKDTVIKKLESSIAEHIAISSQVPILMEKVKSLEEQLKKSELRLQNANALNAG
ncbi:WPP DOMAIN-INTERACTING TAIL-ANCHORED PROTEIN 2 [Salix viminalis]|uniref:WPP DOMAIN-INTERACTING TAIL-ANCHORED PROTEIN 2 n=1 Tax=Salix viminalis TaxID=40686 RepID=A0A9Q0U070_SALVM|nr:WPP DOMAIN-INTERACTING TAIL-ANCHORED PROTEIN 2 [Salix viminalis]